MADQHVFLAYSRKDQQWMQLVRDSLLMARIAVWTDENIEVGTPSWLRAIEQAIEESGAIVVILSPDATKSHWVQAEINYAETHKKPIFPILVRGDERSAIPFGLAATQYLDARKSFAEVSSKLVDAIYSRIVTEDLHKIIEATPKFAKPKSENGNHVFMSYVREDESIMERVYDDLIQEGLKVWVDIKSLVAGTRHYTVALGRAIESSDCVVVILSPEAKESEGVLNELSHADKHKKPIIPLLARGDEITSVPFVITNAQWIDGRENYLGDVRRKAKRKLLADLHYYIPNS